MGVGAGGCAGRGSSTRQALGLEPPDSITRAGLAQLPGRLNQSGRSLCGGRGWVGVEVTARAFPCLLGAMLRLL